MRTLRAGPLGLALAVRPGQCAAFRPGGCDLSLGDWRTRRERGGPALLVWRASVRDGGDRLRPVAILAVVGGGYAGTASANRVPQGLREAPSCP